MWSKLTAIAVCVFAIAVGLWFVSKGTFGAALTGYAIIALFSIIMGFNAYDLMEQKVNTSSPVTTLHFRENGQWVEFARVDKPTVLNQHLESLEYIADNPQNFSPEDHAEAVKELAMYRELNTPDQSLIHPDNAMKCGCFRDIGCVCHGPYS